MKPLRILATLLVAMACALPAIAQSDETAKRFHVFPVLADGGGWLSVLLVTNVAQSSSFCTFELHGLSLDRFREVSGITVSGSTATFSLDGPGGYLTWRTKDESALASGYATLDCTVPTVAQVLYASGDGSGVTGMATVFSSQAGTFFQFTVLTADASLGIAIANDTNTRTSCEVVLEDVDRMNLGDATFSILSKSNVARFLSEIIQIPPGFASGSATISCDQQVSVIGLQFAGVVFTTLPPTVLSTTPVSTTQPTPPTATGDPWSRASIERFRGTWRFTYTKNGAAITETFVLNILIEDDDAPGEWAIGGIQDDGKGAVVFYSRDLDSYASLKAAEDDEVDDVEGLYSFNLTSPTTVSGCYFEQLSSSSFSSCYPMTGVRTSLSTSALSRATSILPYTTAAQAELAEIGAAENFGNDMQTEVNPMIIRALEDIRAYFAAHPEH